MLDFVSVNISIMQKMKQLCRILKIILLNTQKKIDKMVKQFDSIFKQDKCFLQHVNFEKSEECVPGEGTECDTKSTANAFEINVSKTFQYIPLKSTLKKMLVSKIYVLSVPCAQNGIYCNYIVMVWVYKTHELCRKHPQALQIQHYYELEQWFPNFFKPLPKWR